jgi:response regulator of citrate/malate metabolism
MKNGAPFDTYWRYIRYLNLRFTEVFQYLIENRYRKTESFLKKRERELIAKAKFVLEELKSKNQPIQTAHVARAIGISRSTLWRYKTLARLVQRERHSQSNLQPEIG